MTFNILSHNYVFVIPELLKMFYDLCSAHVRFPQEYLNNTKTSEFKILQPHGNEQVIKLAVREFITFVPWMKGRTLTYILLKQCECLEYETLNPKQRQKEVTYFHKLLKLDYWQWPEN